MTSESATSPAIRPPQVEQPPPHEIPVISELISAAPPSPAPQITMMDIVNSNGILTDQLVDEEPSFTSIWIAMSMLRSIEDTKLTLGSISWISTSLKWMNMRRQQQLMVKPFVQACKFSDWCIKQRWPCARWYADPDASFLDPPQCIEEEEDEVEEMEEVEEVEEEVEEVGEVEEVEEEQEEVIDSASAEIPNGEIPNGGTVLEDTCDVGKKPDMPI
ncbi:unnamed protein product [Arabidopsis lyrata]|nr:unnamed protein product [Arabidopsis lyrata]